MIKRIVTTALIAGTAALAASAPALAAEPLPTDAVTSTVEDFSTQVADVVPGQADDRLLDFSGSFSPFNEDNSTRTVTGDLVGNLAGAPTA